MSGKLTPRILKETQSLMEEPLEGITIYQDESNSMYFHAIILGPLDTPFEGGAFKLEIFLPDDYPLSPPKYYLRFFDQIFFIKNFLKG